MKIFVRKRIDRGPENDQIGVKAVSTFGNDFPRLTRCDEVLYRNGVRFIKGRRKRNCSRWRWQSPLIESGELETRKLLACQAAGHAGAPKGRHNQFADRT